MFLKIINLNRWRRWLAIHLWAPGIVRTRLHTRVLIVESTHSHSHSHTLLSCQRSAAISTHRWVTCEPASPLKWSQTPLFFFFHFLGQWCGAQSAATRSPCIFKHAWLRDVLFPLHVPRAACGAYWFIDALWHGEEIADSLAGIQCTRTDAKSSPTVWNHLQ